MNRHVPALVLALARASNFLPLRLAGHALAPGNDRPVLSLGVSDSERLSLSTQLARFSLVGRYPTNPMLRIPHSLCGAPQANPLLTIAHFSLEPR